VLDRRLRTLIEVATAERFKLAVIYQGLDFRRRPLPTAKVRADLELFAGRDATAPPFRIYDKPLLIWSGTWRYSARQIARVTERVRPSLLVLASEKHAEHYARVAHAVDGDSYYWSSVDPLRTPGYPDKLRQMGRAVHRRHGLWIAPASPGFDARLVGGTRVVGRRGGETLRRSLDAATASDPDGLAVISWNEFSENSQIEPSETYGFQSLRVIADVLRADMPTVGDLDSSDSPPTGAAYGLPLAGGFVVVLLGCTVLASRRRRARRGGGARSASDPGRG
jgi:hypothetical protein